MSPFPADTRKYLIHAAHRSVGVSSATAAFKACDPLRFAPAEPGEPGEELLTVALLAPEDWGPALAVFSRYLGQRLDARCLGPSDEPIAAHVSLLLAGTDALGQRPLALIERWCAEGAGVVALGISPTPCRAVRQFQQEVLGLELGQPPSTPVLRLADDARVVLVARRGQRIEPAAWVRRHGLGRVFATTLRAAKDTPGLAFLRLVAAAVAWTAGREMPPGRLGSELD